MAEITGTLQTVTPAAALVGLFGDWLQIVHHTTLGTNDVIYLMVVTTCLAHGVKAIGVAVAPWVNKFLTPKVPPPPAA
jgi:hypothetical protein